MKILQLHCDSIEYTPTKKEIQIAEDIPNLATVSIQQVVVAFISIEKNDASETIHNAVSQIRSSMKNVGCNKLLLYPYAHLSSNLAPPKTALSLLCEMKKICASDNDDPTTSADSTNKTEVHSAPFGWTKSYQIKVKGHPLAESFKTITKNGGGGGDTANSTFVTDSNSDASADTQQPSSTALTQESTIKSYWYILTPQGQMTPVDDYDFTTHQKLEVLAKYEAAKKRSVDEPPPHVSLMKKMAIADYEPASDSGNMRFYPNGRLIKSLIEQYVTNRIKDYGGYEVETPIMYDSHHPSMESYFNRFPARQYNIDSEGKHLFLRFAACFGQFLMANDFQMSYKNLPYRLYELTRYSFRREQSGELVGLRRLRAFTMPDCHAFCADMTQAISELQTRFDLSKNVLQNLDIAQDNYEMAIRFTQDFYEQNKSMIHNLVKKHGKPVLVEMWKKRFFYFVLKWEFNYIDSLGKASALSTDQIDIENGERYGIQFVDQNNSPQHPLILHNSPSGAIERVIYVLLENAAQDISNSKKPSLPLWLAPTQVRIIPIANEFMEFSQALADKISSHNIRVDIDDRNESIGKRIREAEKEWITYTLVIGQKEVDAKTTDTITVRCRQPTGNALDNNVSFDDFIADIKKQIQNKPFSKLNMSQYLSKRPQIMV